MPSLLRGVRKPLVWALTAAISFVALVLAIWVLPLLLTRHLATGLTAAARLKAENDARTPVVAALALIGAAALTAGVTWRATKSTLAGQDIDREGQITDRFSKAIDQLGNKSVDVRMGGIYSLERIARDSARDRTTIMEILTAFIRNHSSETPERLTRSDIQAVATVIGRRNASHDTGRIDLARANLAGAILRNAFLANADLAEANLTGADLFEAILIGADLFEAILTDANLMLSNLTGANLNAATLIGANLISADLTHADLAEANLTGADLSGAFYPPDMTVPEGWVRDSDSGRLKRANGDPSDDGQPGDDPPA